VQENVLFQRGDAGAEAALRDDVLQCVVPVNNYSRMWYAGRPTTPRSVRTPTRPGAQVEQG
jgi:hypothetical protein